MPVNIMCNRSNHSSHFNDSTFSIYYSHARTVVYGRIFNYIASDSNYFRRQMKAVAVHL